MKLTMRYFEFYPMHELELIGQMLNSSKNYWSLLSESVEAADNEAIRGSLTEEQRSCDAEAAFVYDDFLSEVNQLSTQMAVVALHSLGEKTLRKLLHSLGKTAGPKFKQIERGFLEAGIDLKGIGHYTAFTETRYISNSIKHSGVVSKELAAYIGSIYPHPKLGEPIKIENTMLEIYFFRTKSFLSEICQLANTTDAKLSMN